MNALLHGLARITQPDPAISAEVERLAKWICGNDASPSQYSYACAIAEHEIILRRVDAAYVAILERATKIAHGDTPNEFETLRLALSQLAKLDRYKQRALSRRRQATERFYWTSICSSSASSRIE